jgi:signal transduction histidine kinase/CheY-like chemotaxis protein
MTAAAVRETGADELDERRLQVIAAQVTGVRWQVGLTVLVIAALAWRDLPAWIVIGWVVVVISAREYRSAGIIRLAADRGAPIAPRLREAVRLNLLIGVCYGLAALFMLRLDTTLDAVLTMILISLAAGGVAVSSTVMRAYMAYAAPMFVPIAFMWALAGPWLGWAIAVLVLLFFGVQMRFARGNLETFEQSFRIRLENEALARHLASESIELERTRDAAVQANLEKSRFLAAASHDLRQPLQALALNSGELARLPLPGDAKAIAADIGTSVEQLRSMLDALLDLSKLDAGVIVAQPRRVRLDVLVGTVVATFRAAAVARGLELRGDCPDGLAVHTDPELLRRMLANLIDNAIKFTPAGAVDVMVSANEREVEVAIRDSGPGIAPEHHRIVFEDLVRLPRGPQEQRPPGHGLGLGIVRRAAALMGLKVEIDSVSGPGATFRWRMPRAATEDRADAVAGAGWSLAGRRVIVLDDDPMVRAAYAKALEGIGARADTAATIADAMARVGSADAAIVDWRLTEDADGFVAIGQLRERRPGLPVVMVTADTGLAIADAADRHGVALLRKPVDRATLGHALTVAIAGPAADSEARRGVPTAP